MKAHSNWVPNWSWSPSQRRSLKSSLSPSLNLKRLLDSLTSDRKRTKRLAMIWTRSSRRKILTPWTAIWRLWMTCWTSRQPRQSWRWTMMRTSIPTWLSAESIWTHWAKKWAPWMRSKPPRLLVSLSLRGQADETPFDLEEMDTAAEPASDDDMDAELDFLADADEAATKLDLARAYIDMGDTEGAKDILSEVSQEGSDEQKREAAELLARIE